LSVVCGSKNIAANVKRLGVVAIVRVPSAGN